MVDYLEAFSNTKSLSILSHMDSNSNLLITGYNGILANNDTRAARDFYLLLMVYVNYFCTPVFSLVLNGLWKFGRRVQSKFSEIFNFVYLANFFFVEDKEYILMMPSLGKKQVEFSVLSENTYCKTVLL
jgi:hypothetical protein